MKLTQVELARRVGRTHGWLSAIENSSAGEVPAELLTALAVELHDDPGDYLRLAGRAVLRAESVLPTASLDPRVLSAIDDAVSRAIDRLGDRLVEFLDGRLPRNGTGGAR